MRGNHSYNRDPYDYIMKVKESLSLYLVSPFSESDKNCTVLVANMYGKSKFGKNLFYCDLFVLGEDLLMNVSLEKTNNGKVKYTMKIRSKTRVIHS